MKELTMNDLMSRKEAAELAGIDPLTLYHLTRSGMVTAIPFGERVGSGAPVATVYTSRMVQEIKAQAFPVVWLQEERDQILTIEEMAAELWPEDDAGTRYRRLKKRMHQSDRSLYRLVGRVALFVRRDIPAVRKAWGEVAAQSVFYATGEDHPSTVLTDAQIAEMKRLREFDPKQWTYEALGKRFNVSGSGAYRAMHDRAEKDNE